MRERDRQREDAKRRGSAVVEVAEIDGVAVVGEVSEKDEFESKREMRLIEQERKKERNEREGK